MKHPGRTDELVLAYSRWILRWRFPILVVTILLVAICGSGMKYLTITDDYRAWFSEDNPQLQTFEMIQNVYSKSDNILFVLSPGGGDVLTAPVLEAVSELTREAWQIPHAIRVDSLTNFQHTRAQGDDLVVEDLVAAPGELSSTDLAEIRRVALSEPLLLKRLISPTAHVTGVNVMLELPGEELSEVADAVGHAREIAERFRKDHPDIEVRLTGIALVDNAFTEATIEDMTFLVPLMYLVIFCMLFAALRSLSSVVATMIVLMLSIVTAMGAAGWWGVELTPPTAQVPTIIMILAVADCMHILIVMVRDLHRGAVKHDALTESLRVNIQPIFLTTLSTCVGFLCLNFSDVPPYRELGNMTVVGVVAAFVLSVLFLPALMSVMPLRVRQAETVEWAAMDRVADFVIRRRRELLGCTAVVFVVLGLFALRNTRNDQLVNYFDESVEFRRDSYYTMYNLTGIYHIEYSLDSGTSGGVSEPAYLEKLDELSGWLLEQPEVMQVTTLSQIMKRLNMNMNGDDPEWYRIPQTRDLAAQLLLLYELSLPYGLGLDNQVNVDKSATRIFVTLEDLTTQEMQDINWRVEQWLVDNAPGSMSAYGSGPLLMFAHVSERNVKSMVKGTLAAFGIIAVVLMITLRSIKLGLLSLIPNMLPALAAFGVWGIFFGEVGMGLASVSVMSLGIVVDDTIHFLSKYLRACKERELDAESAVRYAFSSVGVALLATSVILVAGFSTLAFSDFLLNSGMAILTALAIVFALLADFFLLPPLLIQMEKRRLA